MQTFIKAILVSILCLPSSGLAQKKNDQGDKGVETRDSGPSIKDGADKAAGQNRKAEAQQYLSGALMFTMAAQKYGECSSQNYGACVLAAIYTGMGVMSMAQGKEHGNVASAAGLTSWNSDGFGSDPYGLGGGQGSLLDGDNALTKDPQIIGMKQNIDTLKAGGFYDPKTQKINMPKGESYDAKTFASEKAMLDAGLPGDLVSGAIGMYDTAAKKALAKVEKMKIGALTAASGFDEGGGGGGSGAWDTSGGAEEYSSYAGGAGSGLGSSASERDPAAAVAGMQKNYNGDPIGVAADSIFLMMNRRYKVKDSQESFFTESELALRR